jgi:hypothetical protein
MHARPFNRLPSRMVYASNSKSFSQRFSARLADSDPARRVTARAALQRRKAACSASVGWTSSRPRSTAAGTLQLCARWFVCYPVELVRIKFPRRSPGRRITPEARALDSRPSTAGRASTPQSGRALPPLSCRAQYQKKTGNDVTRHGHGPSFNDGNQLPETREDSDVTHLLGSRALLTHTPPARR